MGAYGIICNVVWLHGVVSNRRRRFSLGYCCKGRGIFKVVPARSWYPMIVHNVIEVNGGCEFSRTCLLFSCPLNKATYESIAEEYKLDTVEAQKLEGIVRRIWGALQELDPGIVESLQRMCTTGGLLAFKGAPILLGKT